MNPRLSRCIATVLLVAFPALACETLADKTRENPKAFHHRMVEISSTATPTSRISLYEFIQVCFATFDEVVKTFEVRS